MTAFDRVERHLPELFEELAGAGTPDYFDDMLRTTTQARQRPAWSTLERWLPMGVIALHPSPVPAHAVAAHRGGAVLPSSRPRHSSMSVRNARCRRRSDRRATA